MIFEINWNAFPIHFYHCHDSILNKMFVVYSSALLFFMLSIFVLLLQQFINSHVFSELLIGYFPWHMYLSKYQDIFKGVLLEYKCYLSIQGLRKNKTDFVCLTLIDSIAASLLVCRKGLLSQVCQEWESHCKQKAYFSYLRLCNCSSRSGFWAVFVSLPTNLT